MARKPRPKTAASSTRLRIIGGQWRGRRLSFPLLPGLRPTPDRVRETLFNWLNSRLPGSRCLDLFAGSGALGLEALSREAAQVDFVEQAKPAANAIRSALELLEAGGRGRVHQADAGTFIRKPPAAPYDLIFLDPPFHQGWLDRILPLLGPDRIAPEGRIYVEHEVEGGEPQWPEAWTRLREKRAGQVAYCLFAVDQAGRSE